MNANMHSYHIIEKYIRQTTFWIWQTTWVEDI